jgi:Cu(I)/Ag(I) efflux system periplasmic protein CusF
MSLAPHRLVAALCAAAFVAGAAFAQQDAGHGHGAGGAVSATPAGASAEASASGEIRRVDRAGGKLTLRHGEIPNLDMPPMTMVFRVRDGALLEGLKEGDRVRFRAEKDGSQYVVTQLVRE